MISSDNQQYITVELFNSRMDKIQTEISALKAEVSVNSAKSD